MASLGCPPDLPCPGEGKTWDPGSPQTFWMPGFIRVYCFHIYIDILYIYMYTYIHTHIYIYIYVCIHAYDICYCVFIVRSHVLECLNAKTREFWSLEKATEKTVEPNIQLFGGTQPWVEHRFCPKDGTRKDDQRNGCFAGGIGFFGT